MIQSFVAYKKSVDNDVTYEENYPTSKFLVSFLFFNMTNLLQIWEVLQKSGRKNVTKILKITGKG